MLRYLTDDSHPAGLEAVAAPKMGIILQKVQCARWILVPVLVRQRHGMVEVQMHVKVVQELLVDVTLSVHASVTAVLRRGTIQPSTHEVRKLLSVTEARHIAVVTVSGDLRLTTVTVLAGTSLQNHHVVEVQPLSRGRQRVMSRTENGRRRRVVRQGMADRRQAMAVRRGLTENADLLVTDEGNIRQEIGAHRDANWQ